MKVKNYCNDDGDNEACADAVKIYEQIAEMFEVGKADQNADTDDFWSIYNCEFSDQQVYTGNTEGFVPVVRDCINARVKKFVAQLFPSVGNSVTCVSESGDLPRAEIAVMERHTRYANLRSVVKAMLKNGDIEGQYSVMVDWHEHRTNKKSKQKTFEEGIEVEGMKETETYDAGPVLEIIPMQDMAVWPATADTLEDALNQGGHITIARRMTLESMDKYVEQGKFVRNLVDRCRQDPVPDRDPRWSQKERASDAGVKVKGKSKFCLVYQTYFRMELDGEDTTAIIFFGGPNMIIGIIKLPFWSGKLNILSAPVEKIAGSFWGKSKIAPVASLQYSLNDAHNMGLDSSMYTLLPITFTDPNKNPNVASMVMALGAVWLTDPATTKFQEMPQLWKEAQLLVANLKMQIMESMDVNDAMLGKAPAGRKNAQAIAQQTAESAANANDVVQDFQTSILDPMLELFFEMDMQFRDEDLFIMQTGELGRQAKMERIPPLQFGERYWWKWNGTDQVMGLQRTQMMISVMNVLRGIPPQQLNGRRLDIGPILDFIGQAVFGPQMTQQILIDDSNKLSLPPEQENEMLNSGLPVMPSPLDNHPEHIQSHQEDMKDAGDPRGFIRKHIMHHMVMMQQQQQPHGPQQQGGTSQAPAGAPSGQPQPGQPRPGAQPGQQRPAQNPAGAVHQDQMADPSAGMRG